MKAIERLYEYIDSKGYRPTNFEKEIGLSSGYLSIQKKRNADIGETVVNKINDYCQDINIEWLLTGQGSMLRETKRTEKIYTPLKQDSDITDLQHEYSHNIEKKQETSVQFYDPENKPTSRKLIPFYDTTAVAGTLQVSNMDPVAEPAEYIDAGDWFLDADSAMRVHGDSMFPEYKSGNIVVMREVFDKRLIVYGEDYMIQTNEYKVIKRLMQSGEKESWLACSVNDEVWETGPLKGRLIHEPFPVFIDDVTKLCRIIGCVKRTESSRIVYNKNKKI